MSVTERTSHRAALAGGAFLRVVNWHNTPERGRARLRAELVAYLRDHRPVVPEDLDRLFDTGRWGHDRPGLLVAFYDGYRNGASVAAPVCDELGITAWFLPPTAFLDTPVQEQHAFADAHDITLVPEEREQARVAMTWDELEVVGRRHVVAAHTATHGRGRRARGARAGPPDHPGDRPGAPCHGVPLRPTARPGLPRLAGRGRRRRPVRPEQHRRRTDLLGPAWRPGAGRGGRVGP